MQGSSASPAGPQSNLMASFQSLRKPFERLSLYDHPSRWASTYISFIHRFQVGPRVKGSDLAKVKQASGMCGGGGRSGGKARMWTRAHLIPKLDWGVDHGKLQ